jgi:ferritin-like metal-binding protein YciE
MVEPRRFAGTRGSGFRVLRDNGGPDHRKLLDRKHSGFVHAWHERCTVPGMNIFHLGQGKITTLHELFLEQLKDLFDAETQLIDALPEMAEAAHSPELKQGFRTHLEEKRQHARRIEEIFQELEEGRPTGKTCPAMKGLIKEGKETINENASPQVKDAALIAAAQRVEHYEIAGYGSVRTYAQLMGHSNAAALLQATLDEEAATDQKLTAAALKVNADVPVGHAVA